MAARQRLVLRAGAGSAANLRVLEAEGRLVLGRGATAQAGTVTEADTVVLRGATAADTVAAVLLRQRAGASVATVAEAPGLPLRTPSCPIPHRTCTAGPTSVARGTTVTLGPGDHGAVRVAAGATLRLEPGLHLFCSLRVGVAGAVRASADGAVALHVTGDLTVAADASIAPELGGADPVLTVEGAQLRLGADAMVQAMVQAPAAHLRMRRRSAWTGSACVATARMAARTRLSCSSDPGWMLVDVSDAAGIDFDVDYADPDPQIGLSADDERAMIAGGAASGDYDGDGYTDLFVPRGWRGAPRLLHNNGDGTFTDRAKEAGVDVLAGGPYGTAPLFADFNGDGVLDLFVAAGLGDDNDRSFGSGHSFYLGNVDGTFTDATTAWGLSIDRVGAAGLAAGDYDGDGDLDVFVTHWALVRSLNTLRRLWRNDGDRFTDVTLASGADVPGKGQLEFFFTPVFADYDDDGDADVLLTGDFDTSRILRNRGDGTFENATQAVQTDENAMGSAVGDYDNDGDLDWFVTSIWDPDTAEGNWGITGNRLYRNTGGGVFEDATDEAGVRIGWWGWGACMADFNLDGHLDILHVNGFDISAARKDFRYDPSVLYVASGMGTFSEQAATRGFEDYQQGRGVVCFDYDRDGDVDVFVANSRGERPRLWRNEGGNARRHVNVRLAGLSPNTQGVHARVEVATGDLVQMRELRAGNNFESADPVEAHFGLAAVDVLDELRVTWSGGAECLFEDVDVSTSSALRVLEPSGGPCVVQDATAVAEELEP
jgi:hypothetical protein